LNKHHFPLKFWHPGVTEGSVLVRQRSCWPLPANMNNVCTDGNKASAFLDR